MMGGMEWEEAFFYCQLKISPVEVASSVLFSMQMFLRRVSKGLESFTADKSFLDSFPSPNLSSGNPSDLIMQHRAGFGLIFSLLMLQARFRQSGEEEQQNKRGVLDRINHSDGKLREELGFLDVSNEGCRKGQADGARKKKKRSHGARQQRMVH